MLPMARVLASNGTLVGIGLTPEGINQNYVMYDFMTEMTLHAQPIDTAKWYIYKHSIPHTAKLKLKDNPTSLNIR